MNFFKTIRIGSQMMAIGTIAMIGFVIIAAVYMISSMRLNQIQEQQERALAGQSLITDVKYEFLNARRREKDFLLRLDNDYVRKHAQLAQQIRDNLEVLKNYQSSTANRQQVDEVAKGFSQYEAQFQMIANGWNKIGLDEKSGLRGSLRASVHNVEDRLKAFEDEELTVKMLMMRRHEKDFLMRLTQKYVDRISKREQEFKTILANRSYSPEDKAEIVTLLDAYVRDFNNLSSLRMEMQAQTVELSKLFAATEPQFKSLLESSETELMEIITSAESNAGLTKQVMILAVIVVALGVFGLCLLIGRGFSIPIRKMVTAMTELAGGNKEIEVPATDYRNELGDMASAVQVFKENAVHMEKLEEDRKLAQKAAELEKQVWMAQMADDFDERVGTVIDAVANASNQVENSAQTVSSSAHQTSDQASEVATAAVQASSNVQTVATAAEELSASVKEIDRQVQESSRIAMEAVGEVKRTDDTVRKLAESAEKIDAAVVMISEIAEKTNLLALNATIEAARAGDAGKGFAVVASEVKDLAGQTSKATSDISRQVTDIQTHTKEAVDAIRSISSTIDGVSEISNAIASAVQEQTATTQEIARNTQQAAVGTEQVTGVIGDVTQAADNSGRVSGEMLDASQDLSHQSQILRSEVDKFLQEVRTG